jgi:hypothetical protein
VRAVKRRASECVRISADGLTVVYWVAFSQYGTACTDASIPCSLGQPSYCFRGVCSAAPFSFWTHAHM